MILHGIEAPNIIHTNTLAENLADIQEKDRFDVVLANPPFGGKERKEVQQNFPIRTGETAFLFLQHFIKMLKAGGRGGVVIKNTFLSNTDNASVSLRKLLLESCNLHTVLDCPGGTFQGAGVKTVVLFFEKGAPTRKVWYYQLDPGRNLGKTNPLNDDDLAEFVELQKTFADSPKSWSVDAKTHRPDDLRPLGEEPERRRGSRAPQPAGDHGRDRRAGCRERGGAGEHQGAAMKSGVADQEARRCLRCCRWRQRQDQSEVRILRRRMPLVRICATCERRDFVETRRRLPKRDDAVRQDAIATTRSICSVRASDRRAWILRTDGATCNQSWSVASIRASTDSSPSFCSTDFIASKSIENCDRRQARRSKHRSSKRAHQADRRSASPAPRTAADRRHPRRSV